MRRKSQSAAHLARIKKVITGVFPDISGAVTETDLQRLRTRDEQHPVNERAYRQYIERMASDVAAMAPKRSGPPEAAAFLDSATPPPRTPLKPGCAEEPIRSVIEWIEDAVATPEETLLRLRSILARTPTLVFLWNEDSLDGVSSRHGCALQGFQLDKRSA